MDKLAETLRRLTALLSRRRIARELDEEIRIHLEMKARDHQAAGMSAEDARRAARLEFGNPSLTLEDSRDEWRFTTLEDLVQDVRYAWRGLRRSPAFTIAVVTTLALGIGANTTIFALVDAVMLRTLPVDRPGELYVFGTSLAEGTMRSDEPGDRHTSLFSHPLYRDLRRDTRAFSDLAAISSYRIHAHESADGAPGSAAAAAAAAARLVSGNFFSVLGLEAAHGRVFGVADDEFAGEQPVAVLSHGYWSRRFGADPAAIGRTLHLNGTAYRIVGVTPAGFHGVDAGTVTDVWIPVTMQSQLERTPPTLDDRGVMWLRILGRLAPGSTAEVARAQARQFFRERVAEHAGAGVTPEIRERIGRLDLELVSFAGGFGGLRRAASSRLMLLTGVVALVLLIACANIANLLLARSSARRHEISLRLALGSGRARLMRQMLTESLLLASLGGVAGVMIARWSQHLSIAVISSRPDLPLDLRFDVRVLGFSAVLTILTAIAFGLAPAWRAVRGGASQGGAGRRGVLGRSKGKWGLREALVVSQVAGSLFLLVGAGLFLRSVHNLGSEELGFAPEGVLLVSVDTRGAGVADERLVGLYDEVVTALEGLPGVISASFSFSTPFSDAGWTTDAFVQGYEPRSSRDLWASANVVTPGHLEAIGIPLIEGRALRPQDRDGAPRVAVVNRAFAEHFFGGESAVGKRFGLEGSESAEEIEIVGVTENLKYEDVREEPLRFIYLPVAQASQHLGSLVIRTSGDVAVLAPRVRAALDGASERLPVLGMTTLVAQVDRTLREDRLFSRLAGAFAGLALLLACIGLYGVLAYSVARRTNEIGIRVALGAARVEVLRMVLAEGLRLVLLGVLVGVPAGLAAGRAAASQLHGLEPTDPATLLVATVTLVSVAAFAGFVPAWRASMLDPLEALRHE